MNWRPTGAKSGRRFGRPGLSVLFHAFVIQRGRVFNREGVAWMQNIAVLDVAVLVIVVAVLVLTGYGVSTMIRVRRAAAESERLLASVNDVLPAILRNIEQTSDNIRSVSARAKKSADEVAALAHAVGEVGRTVDHVHGIFRGRVATILTRLAGVASGVWDTVETIKGRTRKEERGGNV